MCVLVDRRVGKQEAWGRRCSKGVAKEGGMARFGVLECEFGHPAGVAEGLRGGGGPRPSRKFRRPPRFRCPVHIITVLRIPAPEIVRALVAFARHFRTFF